MGWNSPSPAGAAELARVFDEFVWRARLRRDVVEDVLLASGVATAAAATDSACVMHSAPLYGADAKAGRR